jgi:hypothetical protein
MAAVVSEYIAHTHMQCQSFYLNINDTEKGRETWPVRGFTSPCILTGRVDLHAVLSSALERGERHSLTSCCMLFLETMLGT